MTLAEYILTYKGTNDNGEEGLVFNIPDYYERYIKPLDKKFAEYSFYGSRTVICPLHDDNDPSLGLINHRFLSDVKIYHCFGCGSSGTIVRLHQIIQEQYNNRKLTEEESCRDLASLFGVDLSDFNEIADDDYDSKYIDMLKRISKLKKSYTSREYAEGLLNLRREVDLSLSDRLRLMNTENIKMIATQKKMYS